MSPMDCLDVSQQAVAIGEGECGSGTGGQAFFARIRRHVEQVGEIHGQSECKNSD